MSIYTNSELSSNQRQYVQLDDSNKDFSAGFTCYGFIQFNLSVVLRVWSRHGKKFGCVQSERINVRDRGA